VTTITATAAAARPPSPARLRLADLARLAAVGLRTRKLRASLSALGIAIGVAAIVAVLGLSQSSSAGLQAEISQLGTNLLTVQTGQSLTGGTAELPTPAPVMIARLPGVTSVQSTATISGFDDNGVNAYRTPLINPIKTNGLSVDAASLALLAASGTSIAQGSFLNAATAREQVTVLGAAAAAYLGIDRIWPGERIWAGTTWFYVAGILKPDVLAPEIDSSVLVGYQAAETYLGFDGYPSTVYVRATTSRVTAVDNLLAAQANPENPGQVDVSQPSSALTAQADAAGAFNTLFLGLGAVALLVGAVGVASIMVISVLERRSEIAAPRPRSTRGQIRTQFLSEAVLLACSAAPPESAPGAGHGHLRPRQGLGHRDPGEACRRAGCRRLHRGPRRAAARAQSRPPLAHPGPVVPMTAAPACCRSRPDRALSRLQPGDARHPATPAGSARAAPIIQNRAASRAALSWSLAPPNGGYLSAGVQQRQ
jgi:putative ABC transport system permease protein